MPEMEWSDFMRAHSEIVEFLQSRGEDELPNDLLQLIQWQEKFEKFKVIS